MKRILIVLMAIVTCPAINAQDADQVERLLDNERFNSAEQVLEKKISEDGAEPRLNYLLVKTYLSQQKAEEARKLVEQYNLNTQEDPMSRIAYAQYLLNTGEKEKAKAIFDEIANDRKSRKKPELLVAIAESHIQSENGDMHRAIELLDEAANRDKNNGSIDVLKGNAYRKLSDANNAYLAYQAALHKDPTNLQAHFQLGTIFVSQKNPSIYLQHFMQAYAVDSTYAPVLEALYDHYYFRDVNEAKRYLKKYIANSDYSVENQYRMTDMQYLTGEYEQAISSAAEILKMEQDDAQPRLYKLMAYSYEAAGDSATALKEINKYFAKEEKEKIIGPDFDIRARLTARVPGQDLQAAEYYKQAFELDTLKKNKAKYAEELARIYKGAKDYSQQAKWMGLTYNLEEAKSNVDLFNWGLAHYNAKEYMLADSVFGAYTVKYPENIFGYYWRAQSNSAIDTSLSEGLAIPYYEKVIEIGEKDRENSTNKKMLVKAYGYLGGYEANTKKDYPASLAWFEKFLEIEPGNADAVRYVDILKTWIAEAENQAASTGATSTSTEEGQGNN